MTPEQIRLAAIEGSARYYSYLEKEGGGLAETRVLRFECQSGGFVKLFLEGRLSSTDGVQVKIYGDIYSEDELQPVRYDRGHRSLLIKAREDRVSVFQALSPSAILVVADLKFLVQRVENWFRFLSVPLQLPISPSSISLALPDLLQAPSDEQRAALLGIFNAPLSYVWGAPGTGKTQFVLARAVLNYCLAGRKVLIVAPTNNAVEQTLRGVLSVLEEAGISRENVIRLGTPSREFYEQYPTICEVRSVEDELLEINEAIRFRVKYIAFFETLSWYSTASAALSSCSANLRALSIKAVDLAAERQRITTELTVKEARFAPILSDIDLLSAQRKKLLYFISKKRTHLSAWFQRKKINAAKAELTDTDNKLKSLGTEYEELSSTMKDLHSSLLRLTKQSDALSEDVSAEIAAVKAIPSCPIASSFSSILSKLSPSSDYLYVLDQANTALTDVKRRIDSRACIYEEMELSKAQDELVELQLRKQYISARSVSSRLESCLVAAATADNYISKLYNSDVFRPEHIFLDEAAFCPLIKCATFLSSGVPLTLLGDHMQLPPVMEAKTAFLLKPENDPCSLWALSALYLGELFDVSISGLSEIRRTEAVPQFSHMTLYSLKTSFRFGNMLASILDRFVYHINLQGNQNRGTSVFYIHVPKKQAGTSEHINVPECEAIRQLLSGESFNSYAVLSPYRAQCKLLARKYVDSDAVFTVHRSQGREWDDVIISVVETTKHWFLKPVLINTAVSRARRRLFIVCDAGYWSKESKSLIGGLLSVAEPWSNQ